jgi:hypothetical protein
MLVIQAIEIDHKMHDRTRGLIEDRFRGIETAGRSHVDRVQKVMGEVVVDEGVLIDTWWWWRRPRSR